MANRKLRGLLAGLLLAALVLSLAACGSGSEPGGQSAAQEKDTVFVPEDVKLPYVAGTVSGGLIVGEDLFVTDAVYETVEEEYGGFPLETSRYRYSLYRGTLGETEAVSLSAFQPSPLPEGMSGSVSVRLRGPGEDGGLWVQEDLNYYSFDPPADFDPEKEELWDYRTPSRSERLFRLLDRDGAELRRIDWKELEAQLTLDPAKDSSPATAFDAQGSVYVNTSGGVTVFDSSLKRLFSLEAENRGGGVVPLGDGSMALVCYGQGVGNRSLQLRRIDLKARDWGESYELPSNAYEVYGGGGDYLFFYNSGEGLYGWPKGAREGRKLFSWLTAGLDQSGIQMLCMLDDGRMAILNRDFENRASNGNPLPRLTLLTETDRSLVPESEKTVLTYATLVLDMTTENMIRKFNRESEDCAIQARVYTEICGGDYMAARQLMTTEMIGGNMPDILDASSAPLLRLANQKMLEDLWPWIENDPELGREALMERVLDAASIDGKLYHVFQDFQIATVKGARSVVGDRMGWTLEDMLAAWETMPEGCLLFSPSMSRATMLNYMLRNNLDKLVDWAAGQCHFDSEEFKALLEFCSLFPAQGIDSAEDPSDLMAAGRQMLSVDTIFDLEKIQLDEAIFGGAVSYIGYPTLDGSCGSSFSPGMTPDLAMSASCKDKEGAWAFIRQLLLSRYEGMSFDNHPLNSLPVNKVDFEWIKEKYMTPVYRLGPDGEPLKRKDGSLIEDSTTSLGSGNVRVNVYATTQEQFDQIMALYNAVDRMSAYDETLAGIVSERAEAYFDGTRSLEETVKLIQSSASLYINESR